MGEKEENDPSRNNKLKKPAQYIWQAFS